MSRQTNLTEFFSGISIRPANNQSDGQPERSQSNSTSSRHHQSSSGHRSSHHHRGRGERDRGRGDGGRERGRRSEGGSNRPSTRRNQELAEVSKETRLILPDILPKMHNINATLSERLHLDTLPALSPEDCPRHPRTAIRVVNADTINAALDLAAAAGPSAGRVAILNLASDKVAGGGWRKGALAQEEALCYRSSLYLSLHKRYYPFDSPFMGLYTRDMVVIRGDMASGHELLADVAPADLPIVSALSVAALRDPGVRKVSVNTPAGAEERLEFARPQDREVMKGKMRLTLRMAASRGHGLLVLGALGCGAFRNPTGEVARCWREVLGETEFSGGWWSGIVFGVLDLRREGNFEIFEETLGGMMV